MKLIDSLIGILTFCLVSELSEAMPINPLQTMTGEFTRCLDGICDKVYKLYFQNNPCFELNKELGVSFSIKDKKYAGQLSSNYDILPTNCTVDNIEIKEPIDLYNFVNDKYDIVYLVLLAAAKIIIGVMAFFLYKLTRNKGNYSLLLY